MTNTEETRSSAEKPKPWTNISLNLNFVPKSHSRSRQPKNTISIEHINLYWIIYDSTIVPIHSIIQFFHENTRTYCYCSKIKNNSTWCHFLANVKEFGSIFNVTLLWIHDITVANWCEGDRQVSQFVHWHWRINNSLYCDYWSTYITKFFKVEFRVSVIFARFVYVNIALMEQNLNSFFLIFSLIY